ncbi:Cyclic di-GMP phosphodiesterase CdpA [Klebsiella pasteurii]|uniref:EAL domain-containing protein n=1 Tax=Klebsiella pasteurii TaxID=2587529 RepID=UPI00115AB2C3|nr:EAL domain-containing protein [Klebsiella pasteurii]MDS7870136.1 EAL domain-containing protein [Klebsiella pasteurii]VUT17909.1 Cyclic di-GMP phosphodiesterase CdpA [Klebsiella pasteurii]
MDYILSPCSLVADGLVKVMMANSMQPVVLPSDATRLPGDANIRRIIVFLPETPARLLATLQQAAAFLERSATPLPMLILSRSPASWLWHTLLHQVIDRHLLSEVRSAASDLPVPSLTAVLQDYIRQRYPSLKQLADEEIRLGGKRPGGLTRPELNAILGLLSGYSVNAQAKRRGISHKTLYNQRTAGLKKMVEHYPQLATRFPGSQTKGQKIQPDAALSAFEREFVHAIHCRQIFPVFQPITDDRMRLKGLEILCRWRQKGQVLLPGEFLPQIRSAYAWLVLTAFMLREAVESINLHPGEFYFSVNISAAIASNDNLIRMLETARQQLREPHLSSRLVLEFAETLDLNLQSKIADNISRLRKQGFAIMLDDCFSQSSVMFPVRSVRFSAYKLDMSIVNDMQRDPHAMALIKSLLYYCQLTGSRCVAEGVDSLDKFNRLRALGIDRFQGYLISPPVERENVSDLIHQLLSGRNLSLIDG